ncbi:MAG: hypothetical protein JWM64_2563, partial [Frankiales bacterium]|nr:hypothetical protein [Frankiales bacterium]
GLRPLAAAAPPAAVALLPRRGQRPEQLPAALVVVAAITLVSVGAAQQAEARSRRVAVG